MDKKRAYLSISVALALFGACTREAPAAEVAASAQAVTPAECRDQLASCVGDAADTDGLVECSTAFAECSAEAVDDQSSRGESLVECRRAADECLSSADDIAAVGVCRDAYDQCVAGVATTAIDDARDAIGEGFRRAGEIIDAVAAGAGAIEALDECRRAGLQCVDDAGSPADALSCADSFNACAVEAVAVVDDALEPLPGPTPGEVIAWVETCRSESTTCLAAALTRSGIGSCAEELGSCLDGVVALTGKTIEEVDALVGDLLPPGVPTPFEVLECNAELSSCLLNLEGPFECGAQARNCLTQSNE